MVELSEGTCQSKLLPVKCCAYFDELSDLRIMKHISYS